MLVHGYGASAIIFYKIMKTLAAQFHLIMIDVIGMGASSRPNFNEKVKTPDEADDFFVEYFEKWRVAMGNLTGFVLAGHSFGGYLCGHYASRYP